MIFCIDKPDKCEISSRTCEIRGWCTVPSFGSGRVRLEIDGIPAPFTCMRRPDVEEAYPGETAQGFVLQLDLTYYMRAIQDSALVLKIIAGETEEAEVKFRVSREALGLCMAVACGL